MCHLGTHTHATLQTSTAAAAGIAPILHPCRPHAGLLTTRRDRRWKRVEVGELRTVVASLAAMAKDCCNMSWSMSPSAWTWHGGQRRERRRPGEHLQLAAASSGGGGTSSRHDLVVEEYMLTVAFLQGGNFRRKGLNKGYRL